MIQTDHPVVYAYDASPASEALRLALSECLDFMQDLALDDAVKAERGRRIFSRGSALLAELRGEGPRYV